MPPQPVMNYEADPRAELEAALARIADDPSDVRLYKQLYEAVLRYKAQGGRALGMFARLAPPPKEPIGRLHHHLRLWAFDFGDSDRLLAVHQAAADCDTPDGTFEPVVIWSRRLLRRMNPRG